MSYDQGLRRLSLNLLPESRVFPADSPTPSQGYSLHTVLQGCCPICISQASNLNFKSTIEEVLAKRPSFVNAEGNIVKFFPHHMRLSLIEQQPSWFCQPCFNSLRFSSISQQRDNIPSRFSQIGPLIVINNYCQCMRLLIDSSYYKDLSSAGRELREVPIKNLSWTNKVPKWTLFCRYSEPLSRRRSQLLESKVSS